MVLGAMSSLVQAMSCHPSPVWRLEHPLGASELALSSGRALRACSERVSAGWLCCSAPRACSLWRRSGRFLVTVAAAVVGFGDAQCVALGQVCSARAVRGQCKQRHLVALCLPMCSLAHSLCGGVGCVLLNSTRVF